MPHDLPPTTMAELVRSILQDLQGHLDLAGLGRQSIRIPNQHLHTWKRQLEDVLRRVEER